MNDHLVDNGLREQWQCQRKQLNDQRCNQDFAPDAFVLQQLRYEPAEAEASLTRSGGDRIRIRYGRCRIGYGERLASKAEREVVEWNLARRVLAFR